jgi:hypothetical protein
VIVCSELAHVVYVLTFRQAVPVIVPQVLFGKIVMRRPP